MRRLLCLLLVGGCTSSGSEPECPVGLAPLTITETEVRDHYVRLVVEYGGGCEDHEFAVWWTGVLAPSIPPLIPLEVQHYDFGDSCEALITDELWIDLSAIHRPGIDEAQVQFVMGTGGAGNTLGAVDYVVAAPAEPPSDDVIAIDRSCGVIGQ
jgi:hypothetical protein